MAQTPNPSRTERLNELLRRLQLAPPAADHDEAMLLLADILNRVEDEMTNIPFDPARWDEDGRMYPPQLDSKRSVTNLPGVSRYRSKNHSALIGENGSISITVGHSGQVIFSKPGADGRDLSSGGVPS